MSEVVQGWAVVRASMNSQTPTSINTSPLSPSRLTGSHRLHTDPPGRLQTSTAVAAARQLLRWGNRWDLTLGQLISDVPFTAPAAEFERPCYVFTRLWSGRNYAFIKMRNKNSRRHLAEWQTRKMVKTSEGSGVFLMLLFLLLAEVHLCVCFSSVRHAGISKRQNRRH